MASGLAMAASTMQITTLGGRVHTQVDDLKVRADSLSFVSAAGPQVVDFLDLPVEVRGQYGYEPIAGGIARAKQNRPLILTMHSAFRLVKLDEAKARAGAATSSLTSATAAPGLPLGFLYLPESAFGKSLRPMSAGIDGAVMHYYQTFKDCSVLVFVRPGQNELTKVPTVVSKAFASPDFASQVPCVILTSWDASTVVGGMPFSGGAKHDPKDRELALVDRLPALRASFAMALAAAAASSAATSTGAASNTTAAPNANPATSARPKMP